jgi:hypothetical protein
MLPGLGVDEVFGYQLNQQNMHETPSSSVATRLVYCVCKRAMYGTHGNRLRKPFGWHFSPPEGQFLYRTTMMTAGELVDLVSAMPASGAVMFEKGTESRRAFSFELRARGAQAMPAASSSTKSRRSAK